MAFATIIDVLTIFPYLEFGELIDNDVVWLNMMFATVYLLTNTWWHAMRWYVYLDVDEYGDVDFMSILRSDDDVLLCCFYCRVTYIALATRAFMPSDEGFYAKRRWALCQMFLIMD